jgi:hypothetical protein
MQTSIHFLLYLAKFFLEWEMFQTKVVEEIKTFFFNRAGYEITWKNFVERGSSQMTIWRMRIPCCITKATNTHTHTHTLKIRNSYCFFTATTVARTPLNVIFIRCVHWLPCFAFWSVPVLFEDDLLWSRPVAMSWCDWLSNSKNCVECV